MMWTLHGWRERSCGLGSPGFLILPVTSGFNKSCLDFPIWYTQRNMLECVRLALSFPAKHRLWGEAPHLGVEFDHWSDPGLIPAPDLRAQSH